jgi:putative membrane-bound dehydrogenase-like protein
MDIAGHPDGSVYIATRNEILRLRDTKGDGKADEVRRIVFLDTKGNYPHNGLSGLCFDSKGDLYFGMGENIGFDYKLIGSDGTTLVGGGEGGNIFWCTGDGKKLRRVATGFWNPFGICRDIFGRMFAVDNDPDAMPPCRMVHIVEGGDYGYQYRYGRSGRHPFQSWDGQLPGTLPMVTGVGEAPCEVLNYESDGLPREYLGKLLVASWADHRVELYDPEARGASYSAKLKPFVTGGEDFRPVGIAIAPEGSLFVSDWVKRDYNLHGHGAIWHIRWRDAPKVDRPQDPRKALLSNHRSLREAAARELARQDEGRAFLREQIGNMDVRVRTAGLTALLDAGDTKLDLITLASKDPVIAVRAMAVRALVAQGKDASRFLDAKQPAAVRVEAIGSPNSNHALLRLLTEPDPFIRHAAVQRLARLPDLLEELEEEKLTDPQQRIGVLLAWRASDHFLRTKRARHFLSDPDEDVRFLAAKWVADEKLEQYRDEIVDALKDRKLNVRLYFAYSTALASIDGKDVNEGKMADYFLDRLADRDSPTSLRVMALQMAPPNHPRLTLPLLTSLLEKSEPKLQLEVARTLSDLPSPKRVPVLLEAVRNAKLDNAVRGQAVLGLSERSQELLGDLLPLVRGENLVLRDESLRALLNTKLDENSVRSWKRSAASTPRPRRWWRVCWASRSSRTVRRRRISTPG